MKAEPVAQVDTLDIPPMLKRKLEAKPKAELKPEAKAAKTDARTAKRLAAKKAGAFWDIRPPSGRDALRFIREGK